MNVTGIIFTNDATMGELTNKRTSGSIPFGGRYRQIDWALSNMACAGIRNIGVISRHSYQSLMHHIGDGEEWGLELEEGGLEFLTPYAQTTVGSYHYCFFCALKINIHWLLGYYVKSVAHSIYSDLRVQIMRQAKVNCIKLFLFYHLFVIGICHYAVCFGGLNCTVFFYVCARNELSHIKL